jgi:hypothetical protein
VPMLWPWCPVWDSKPARINRENRWLNKSQAWAKEGNHREKTSGRGRRSKLPSQIHTGDNQGPAAAELKNEWQHQKPKNELLDQTQVEKSRIKLAKMNNIHKIQKLIFFIVIQSTITTDPRRSPPSFPYLIENKNRVLSTLIII